MRATSGGAGGMTASAILGQQGFAALQGALRSCADNEGMAPIVTAARKSQSKSLMCMAG